MFRKLRKQKPFEEPRRRQRADMSSLQNNTTVFSYHANRLGSADPRGRQPLSTESKPRRQLPRVRFKSRNWGIAFLVVCIVIFSASLSKTPKVIVAGNSSSRIFVHDTGSYQQTAKKLLAESVLNTNKLTINTQTIVHDLEASFPEIRTATITLPILGHQPLIYVQPAVPQIILATQHDGQFVLDSSGRALVPVTPRLTLPTGAGALPVVSDESSLPAKVGQVVLPAQNVAFVMEVAGQMRAKQLTVSSWRMPSQASELDAYIGGTSYYVRFNFQGNAREEAGTYLAAKNYIDGKHTTPGQYIDVRVSGRAYYR